MTTNTNTTTRTPDISATIVGNVVHITYGCGGGWELDADALSSEVRTAAMLAGLKSKLIDAAAIPRDTETGKSATPEQKAAAVTAMAERLEAGHWNMPTRAREPSATVFIRALAEVTYRTIADTKNKLAEYTTAEKTALKMNPKVLAVMARIMDEEADGDNGDDLIAKMMDGGSV
jgi:hypothetical protein